MNIESLIKKAAQIRVSALTAIHKAGSGYTGSSMSVVEILVALYYGSLNGREVAKVDYRKPGWIDQDYVILGKGQAAPAQYAILADLGFFDGAEMDFLGKMNSVLQARPFNKIPGIPFSIPAHGGALSLACGLAMALKLDRAENRVFAVLGDGELQEGQVWEAAMAAAHYKLNNLFLFVDNDGFQLDGPVRAVMDVNPIQAKFEAFGWRVIQVRDGHNFEDLYEAMMKAFTSLRQPVCLWCHTVKGKGIPFAEGKSGYQNVTLSEEEMNEVIPKLKAIYE